MVGIFAINSIAVCTSDRCSPRAFTGEKRPSPLTMVRSTSIGHAVLGTFCIALISGSGSERREPNSRLSVSSSARFGSRPYNSRCTTSSNVALGARSSISYPR